jgi:hypothetical protein
MLLHLEPRCLCPFQGVKLVDLTIEPFGLRLVGGVDLITAHPYPNKHHSVACQKTKTRKAFYGVLIETSGPVSEWRMTARWSLEGAGAPVTHKVDYRLLDHEFDAASDNSRFWRGTWQGPWADRSPSPDARGCPEMEIVSGYYRERGQPVTYRDTVVIPTRSGLSFILERCDSIALPTIERGRLLDSERYAEEPDRMPPIETAFLVPVKGLVTIASPAAKKLRV